MRTHITYIILIVALALLCLFLFKGGCKTAITSSQEYKALSDTIGVKNRLILALTDSAERIEKKYLSDSEKSAEIIKTLYAEKANLSDVTKKLKGSVTDITSLYRKARGEADTAFALLLADNQANICDSYVWQSQRELYVADSLITQQNQSIAEKNATIQKQIQFRREFLEASEIKDAYYQKSISLLKKDNNKLNNWWHRWGEKVVVGVASGAVGYSVGTLMK